jgi:hypothetical protein
MDRYIVGIGDHWNEYFIGNLGLVHTCLCLLFLRQYFSVLPIIAFESSDVQINVQEFRGLVSIIFESQLCLILVLVFID